MSAALVRLVAAALLLALPLGAQTRSVQGAIYLVRDTSRVPLVGAWVTLHRVGTDSAAPLDSVRTGSDGSYTLRYRPFGAADAIYFASTRYAGIAYFTHPLRAPDVRGEDAEVTVFDTTSAPVPVTVRGRHIIVSAPDAKGAREIIEVFEISNDTSVTGTERGALGTWSVALPKSGRNFALRPGEVPADAFAFANSRGVLHMPLAPGIKQFAVSYTLTNDDFPLDVAIERRTSVLEVLVEDPRADVRGPRVKASEPVSVEGRAFRRFLGDEVPAGATLTIDVPSARPSWTRWILPGVLMTIALAMIATLARPRRRRPRASASAPTTSRVLPHEDHAASLARRIAALDDAFERDAAGAEPAPDARERYERERSALKAQLAAALARDPVAR